MAKSQIQLLTDAVEKLINHPIAPVLPVLPIAPVAPIAPIDNSISQDLIVKFARLEENVRLNFQQVKDAIKELNDGTTSKINDHQNKIETLMENSIDKKEHEKVVADIDILKSWRSYMLGAIAIIGIVVPFIITYEMSK